MDTKTKTREDEKTPAGETQVRELGDVLASNKTESNSKSELLQELNKQYIKPEKLEALTQKDTLAQGRLIDVLGKCDYMELENKADVKIYVRTNQDRTIDVLAFENLEKPKPKNHTQGFTFTKVKDINALNKYVTELKEFDKLNKSDGARLASTIGLAFIGILGGAIYVATTLG
ncbi:hypothetical protein HON01_00160, partial [Candidatus Woesearchaeota archaeon]|nr:hypothetical protein [Candidatus Woesearchaeota archaeon]